MTTSLRENMGGAERAVLLVVALIVGFYAWFFFVVQANAAPSTDPNLYTYLQGALLINPYLLLPAGAFATGLFVGDRTVVFLLLAVLLGAGLTDLVVSATGIEQGEYPVGPGPGSTAVESAFSNGGLAGLAVLGLLGLSGDRLHKARQQQRS